mgnify:CR=1 FL=1
MEDRCFNYHKVKKKYLQFLTSQEVMSEPFRDKLGQLNKFYLPISKMINDGLFIDPKIKENWHISHKPIEEIFPEFLCNIFYDYPHLIK